MTHILTFQIVVLSVNVYSVKITYAVHITANPELAWYK